MTQPVRSRTAGLQQIERRILLHVMAGRKGKEIAPLVGTTYDMVEKYIKSARAKLGDVTRAEAARIVAADAGVDWVQKLDLQIPDLPPPSEAGPDRSGGRGGSSTVAPTEGPPWPFRTVGRPENDLTLAQRWSWILLMAMAFALLAVGLVTTSGSLLDVLSTRFLPNQANR